MKIKYNAFLNTEEEEEVLQNLKCLFESKKKLKKDMGDYVESGGFGVRMEEKHEDGSINFSVYRLVADFTLTKKQLKFI